MLFHDHLALGKITYHHSSLNQCVAYQVGRLMVTILLFVALLLGNALVDLAEMDISFRFLLASISLAAYLVELLVVPT